MLTRFIPLFFLSIVLVSCNDEAEKREILRLQTQEKTKAVFAIINDNWVFTSLHSSGTVQTAIADWQEWNDLVKEMEQKPLRTLGAFRKKSKTFVEVAQKLTNRMPVRFENPTIKSRVNLLTTQLQSLDLYLNLNSIPTDKVISIIQEINVSMRSLQEQFDLILRKEAIPQEEGEADMLRLLDTARAIKVDVKK